jgi:PleD family two-component response regulator
VSKQLTHRCLVYRFEQALLAPSQYGCHRLLLAEFRESVREGAGSRESGGLSMPSTLRDRIKQADLPLVLKGPASRGVPLRILFVHSHAADVERCVEELRRAHFEVSADVVLTPEQFAGRPKSKYYDVVLVEYPALNWPEPRDLEILHLRDRQIPCIFLTDTMQPETVAKLITEGAADCVGMDHLGHLPVVIRRALSDNNLREEREQTEKKTAPFRSTLPRSSRKPKLWNLSLQHQRQVPGCQSGIGDHA